MLTYSKTIILIVFLQTFIKIQACSHSFSTSIFRIDLQYLKRTLESSFSLPSQNLIPLTPLYSQVICDQQLCMQVRVIDHIKQKVNDHESLYRDPFMPPFQKGKFITDLPPTHRLLYNKYYVMKGHLLVVSSNFMSQLSPLTLQDFNSAIMVTKAMKGCFYFNGGKEAGYSQLHKHIQILPESALQFPIIKQIQKLAQTDRLHKNENYQNFYQFQHFRFLHWIGLPKGSIDHVGYQYMQFYEKMIEEIENMKLTKGNISYSLIGTTEFLMMIPRRASHILEEKVHNLWVDCLGFIGLISCENSQNLQQTLKYTPSQILNAATFPK